MATEAPDAHPAIASPGRAGAFGRCPRCGKGALFSGFLTVVPTCPVCGLDFGFTDSGDGPAVFIILIVGFVIVGMALAVEVLWGWPYWLHAVVWGPLVIGLSIGLLRPLKGLFIGVQYRHKAREGRPSEG